MPPVAALPGKRLLTRKAFAAERGVSLSYVARLAREGVLPVRAGNKLDADECNAILDATTDASKANDGNRNGAPPKAAPPGGLVEAKTVHETYRARLAKLRFEEAEGKLVDKAQVEREAYAEGRAVREAFGGLGARLRDKLAGEDDPVAIQQAIDAEVTRILTELAEAKE